VTHRPIDAPSDPQSVTPIHTSRASIPSTTADRRTVSSSSSSSSTTDRIGRASSSSSSTEEARGTLHSFIHSVTHPSSRPNA
jgi:hypothetical protein